ncbi:MAG TPA: hypothetical protein VGE04_08075 [Chloroflexia bacterium]|jgi:hypothetical protein
MAAMLLISILVLAACDLTTPPDDTPRDFNNYWQVGSTISLAKGTEIREGPGTGFCWHTVVPENGWQVKVTGGPQFDDQRRQWYDTSRAALGDHSGGTGWILPSQADHFPTTQYGGMQCAYAVQQPGNQSINWFTALLQSLESWWRSLPLIMQIAVAVIAIAGLLGSLRMASSAMTNLLQAALLGVLLWWVADLTRAQWQSAWHAFTGFGGADLAIALAFVPLIWWAYIPLRRRLPRTFRLALTAAIVLLALFWLAPQRIQGITQAFQGWFRQ